jgi:hypothetical protein
MRQIVGVDFGGPSSASAQCRKIVSVAATTEDGKRYAVRSGALNQRLANLKAPGWTAQELSERLKGDSSVEVVAAVFPFSIPRALLQSAEFASLVNRPRPFETWAAFSTFVAERVPLEPPLDLRAFQAWRSRDHRAKHWTKRSTDISACAQPALKDKFQVLFNMTLLGASLLAALRSAGYSVVPFDEPAGPRRVIEVYPGDAMRQLDCPDYKQSPGVAIDAMLAHCSANGISVEVAREIRDVCETYNSGRGTSRDPDVSDALIACCVGILYRAAAAREVIEPHLADRRSTEGVIWSCTSETAR